MLPNFIICGAAKAGTTALYDYLGQHPEVCLSHAKETHFFSVHYHRGLAWYERFFDACHDHIAIGEASPSYMTHSDAPARIAAAIPNAKLIFMLRDPVARAWSNYWFDVSKGVQSPKESFSDSIRSARGFRRYVKRGFYMEQIDRYLAHFPLDHMQFLFAEHLRSDRLSVLTTAFRFLEVDPDFVPVDLTPRNVARLPRNQIASWVTGKWTPARLLLGRLIRDYLPEWVRYASRPMRNAIRTVFYIPENLPEMAVEDRIYLVGIFERHIDRLEVFLKMDLAPLWQTAASRRI